MSAEILTFSKEGVAIKEIVRRTGHSRGTVRRVLRGEHSDVFRTRKTSLETYLPWLDQQWAAGRHNGAALWRSLQAQGFRGSLRVVTEWAPTLEAIMWNPTARAHHSREQLRYRSDLTDAEWHLIEPYLPAPCS